MRLTFVASDNLISAIPPALKAVKKMWPNCPYPIDVTYNAVAPDISAGDCDRLLARPGPDSDWIGGMAYYIKNHCPDEPFLLMLEDYIIVHVVPERIAIAAEAVSRPDIGMVRLVPTPGPTLPYDEHMGQFDLTKPYATSLQASWWRPSTMLTILEALIARGADSAWHFELEGSRLAQTLDLPIFLGLWRGKGGMSYQNLYRRGKRFPPAEEWIEENL